MLNLSKLYLDSQEVSSIDKLRLAFITPEFYLAQNIDDYTASCPHLEFQPLKIIPYLVLGWPPAALVIIQNVGVTAKRDRTFDIDDTSGRESMLFDPTEHFRPEDSVYQFIKKRGYNNRHDDYSIIAAWRYHATLDGGKSYIADIIPGRYILGQKRKRGTKATLVERILSIVPSPLPEPS